MLRFSDALLIHFAVGSRQRRLDQDMADLNLLGHAVLLAMLIVVGSQIVRSFLDVGRSLAVFDDRVLYFSLFWNRVRVTRLVALVKRFQFFVRRVPALAHSVLLP